MRSRSSVITKLTVAIITMFLVVFVSYTVLVSIRDWQSNKASEEQALLTTSELSALEIQAVFNETFDRLRTEADVLAAVYTAGELNAEMILQTKRQLMAQNEQWLSNSSIFEPNVVTAKTEDGQAFIDASNRFVPYFIRNDDGSLYETIIESYEQEVWYIEPVQYGKTMMTDPYDYEVGTETLSMVSLVVPVTASEDVIGYVSADFAINFLSELVAEHAPTEGVQRVVTNSGRITATSDDASNDTAAFVTKSSALLQRQSSMIEGTAVMFKNQTERSEQLEAHMMQLATSLQTMMLQKNNMLSSMHTIASISEQSAAATEEVSSTATMQVAEVDVVRQNLHELEHISKQLQELMRMFKIA